MVSQLHLNPQRATPVLIHWYVAAQTGKHMPQLTRWLPTFFAAKTRNCLRLLTEVPASTWGESFDCFT